jgi:hypothetical protein
VNAEMSLRAPQNAGKLSSDLTNGGPSNYFQTAPTNFSIVIYLLTNKLNGFCINPNVCCIRVPSSSMAQSPLQTLHTLHSEQNNNESRHRSNNTYGFKYNIKDCDDGAEHSELPGFLDYVHFPKRCVF